jgi:signal transduction histidine kinase
MNMNKKIVMGLTAWCALGLSAGAWAAAAATADEVTAKVKEAAATVKSGGETVLAEFDKKDGKWAWKDTYVFVIDCNNKTIKAHPNPQVKGMKLADLKDKKTGKPFGDSLCESAKKANGSWVEYWWTKPGADGNHRKIAYSVGAGTFAVSAGVYDEVVTVQELDAKVK